jgi:outer membrane protein assembly factor BamA
MIRRLLFLLLLALPLHADDPPFFLERIEVRNRHRVSADVVVAESLLHEGRAYSEPELRDAARRLSRLPFLLSVDFSLEKGTERGKYVLVLTINETKPFFYALDAVPYFEDDQTNVDVDYQDRPASSGGDFFGLGFRWFVGRRGVIHLGAQGTREDRAFTREYLAVSAGYTQYDLFGTRAFVTLNLKQPVEGFGAGLISPQVVVGVPLTTNQTMTLQYDETRFAPEQADRDFPCDCEDGVGQRVVSARWSYNTTNEPFVPTRGTVLSVTPNYVFEDGTDNRVVNNRIVESGPFHARAYGLALGATRYHELSERQSIWGDLRGEWARIERDSAVTDRSYANTATSASVGLGYGFSLWTREERAGGDNRFELAARYTNKANRESDAFHGYVDDDVAQIAWSWIRRSSFGTLRLGVGYAW